MPRNITRITAPSTHPARRTDIAAAIAVAVATPVVPVAVASLTATTGAGRVTLTWSAAAGAVSYDVESGAASTGAFTSLSSAGGTNFADLSASTAAITYYRVRARNAVGAGPYSPVASATATAVAAAGAGSTALIPVPTNLRRLPVWDTANSRGADALSWDGVPGATGYKVYNGDYLVATVTGIGGNPPATSVTPPSSPRTEGLALVVTAVTAQGESIAGTACFPWSAFPPGQPPGWSNPTTAPAVVNFVLAEAEWNAGQPRILVRWGGNNSGGSPFNVYRDGALIAAGLAQTLYLDSAVVPGLSYAYTVCSRNEYASPVLLSPQSAASSATALSGPPALSGTPITITRTLSRDDAVFVFFNGVSGAKDYICYKDNAGVTPNVALKNGKAAGEWRHTTGSFSSPFTEPLEVCIQMNDLDPVNPTTLRLAAVDKLSRYQRQDGMMAMGMGAVPGGPGTPNMNNDSIAQVNGPVAVDGFIKNGQGDPSNVSNIVALSAPFTVSCTPLALTGTDGHGGAAFLDKFRVGDNEPIVQVSLDPLIARNATISPATLLNNPQTRSFKTPKWHFTNYACDNTTTKIFFMPHFMSVTADGDGPGAPFDFGTPTLTNGMHFSNASLTMQPLEIDPASANFGQDKYFSIAGGKTLHVTMEIDAHFNGRRFVLIALKGRGQSLYNAAPTKMRDDNLSNTNRATTDAGLLAWAIGGSHGIVYLKSNGSTTSRPYDRLDLAAGLGFLDTLTNIRATGSNPSTNGTTRDLDKMHRFHLYVSHTQLRVVEETPDGLYSVVMTRPIPGGLQWDEVEPFFVHEVYHTGIDALNGEEYQYSGTPGGPDNRHWVTNRPYTDERHWDNMGAEVLDAFPVEPLELLLDHTSIPANTVTTVLATFAPGTLIGSGSGWGNSGLQPPMAVTILDDTHAQLVITAGAAGLMAVGFSNAFYVRSVRLPIV